MIVTQPMNRNIAMKIISILWYLNFFCWCFLLYSKFCLWSKAEMGLGVILLDLDLPQQIKRSPAFCLMSLFRIKMMIGTRAKWINLIQTNTVSTSGLPSLISGTSQIPNNSNYRDSDQQNYCAKPGSWRVRFLLESRSLLLSNGVWVWVLESNESSW